MVRTVKPTKEQIREYMVRRQGEHRPPPNQNELRRQFGWELIDMERNAKNCEAIRCLPDS